MKPTKIPLAPSPANWNNPFAALPPVDPVAPQASGTGVPPVSPSAAAVGAVCNRDCSAPKLGRVILRREKAHRGGKTVIVVHDFAPKITTAFIDELASKLKKTCGCGGTVKDRTIEIQGDQPAKIRTTLEAAGLRVDGVR